MQEEVKMDVVAEAPEQEVQQEQKPVRRGYDALLKRRKDKNPEASDEVTDDELYDFGADELDAVGAERDDYKQKFENVNAANQTLADVMVAEPKFAKALKMIAEGENVWYALGSVLGPNASELNGDAAEEFKKGQEEYNASVSEIEKNFKQYEKNLKEVCDNLGLTDDQAAELDNAIAEVSMAFITGNIGKDMIELMWKGLDSDAAVAEAAAAGEMAGRNMIQDEVASKKKPSIDAMPDLAGKKTSAEPMAVNKNQSRKVSSFASGLKDIDI